MRCNTGHVCALPCNGKTERENGEDEDGCEGRMLTCRAGTIQSLLVHYRYRNQPIHIDTVIMLYQYIWKYILLIKGKLDLYTIKQNNFSMIIVFDLNYVELILCK